MAGAVQVLALSDDEDHLNCVWNTPRSQPRSRPGIRQCAPITPGDVVCLDSDDEPEVQRTLVISAKVCEPRQEAVRLDGRCIVQENPSSLKLDVRESQTKEQRTPVTAVKTPDPLQQAALVDDCFIVQEKPSSSAKVDRRPKFSLLDDCCIVKETPASSSKVYGRLKSVLVDDRSILKERPSSSSRLPPRATVVKETTVMSETGVQRPDLSCNQSRKRVENSYITDTMSQIPTDWTPDWTEDSHTPPEVPVEIDRHAKRQKTTDVAPPVSPTCDVDMTPETRHVNEEEPCGVGAPRSASRGQKISEEERQLRLREKELEFERKETERSEKKREKEEAKKKQQEEIRQKKEEEKVRKAAAKKAAQERRKADQEAAKFNGKAALKEMIASLDTKVAENGLIGGPLLSRFAEKKLQFTIVSNPLGNSITWCTKRPSLDSLEISQSQDIEVLGSQDDVTGSQVVLEEVDIQYLLFVFEADDFCRMVAEYSLFSHVRNAQKRYPDYTICYLVNKLMSFLKKKDQDQYQAPNDPANVGWRRPPVEKALAGLMTNFTGVRSRLCVDEADVADHVTGLTRTLADSCHKPKLTRLSVNKNGEHVQQKDASKEEIKKILWLKALVAIPKISGPCAVSIGKMYPNMRSLLEVYLDKDKTDREKELLLQDLQRESVFGSTDGHRIGPVRSRQIFRVLMAQDGNLKVDKIDQEVCQD